MGICIWTKTIIGNVFNALAEKQWAPLSLFAKLARTLGDLFMGDGRRVEDEEVTSSVPELSFS